MGRGRGRGRGNTLPEWMTHGDKVGVDTSATSGGAGRGISSSRGVSSEQNDESRADRDPRGRDNNNDQVKGGGMVGRVPNCCLLYSLLPK